MWLAWECDSCGYGNDFDCEEIECLEEFEEITLPQECQSCGARINFKISTDKEFISEGNKDE